MATVQRGKASSNGRSSSQAPRDRAWLETVVPYEMLERYWPHRRKLAIQLGAAARLSLRLSRDLGKLAQTLDGIRTQREQAPSALMAKRLKDHRKRREEAARAMVTGNKAPAAATDSTGLGGPDRAC